MRNRQEKKKKIARDFLEVIEAQWVKAHNIYSAGETCAENPKKIAAYIVDHFTGGFLYHLPDCLACKMVIKENCFKSKCYAVVNCMYMENLSGKQFFAEF